MIWDFTCPDTLATGHLNRSVLSAGAAANEAERQKVVKCRSLSTVVAYSFVPLAVESRGTLGDEASDFIRNLGHRITYVKTEPRPLQFLMQRLGVAVQRGNAARVLGTVPASIGLNELFYI